ncbi:Sds3-like-domain-containing protein [Truncatella angustata]|uniref:Sds3-like-domain-containing protein n=1 Tax=Truncatella angustata TaxID=152316 RepID=A0A9P8UYI3_9PEZI|nr:Sds3-like-domain-containing protein [Truncatella angustata]KAH6660269.1 Sds3-like-domain-containing protein [Truncatella angustata]KAH8202663.1 hypothetical protein TruAng_003149 [Truncatella angustata]
MATGDTAPPLTILPPAIEPLSDDDDGSSPLSDLGGSQNDLDLPEESPEVHHDDGTEDEDEDDEDDDANDTEAETERLFPTPQNPTRHTDALAGAHAFERTPTKLRQGIRVDDDEDEPLSELQGSFTSSPPRPHSSGPPTAEKLPSPTLDILADAAAAQDTEARKRKRTSPPADAPEDDLPARKRSASPLRVSQPDQDGDVAMADDEEPSTNSGEETIVEPTANEGRDGQTDDLDAEAQIEEESRARKPRTVSKKRKSPRAESDEPPEEPADGITAEEDGARTGDDEHTGADVDGEAEAAQRTEEERTKHGLTYGVPNKLTQSLVERKRAALDGLTSIERQFAIFRERLYEERLDQLNREEAMLKADIPTHPDYIAMMECIDTRKDDKLRIAENEFHLNIGTLGRWAVARRAQIHSQYYQDVRETRERIIGELGQYWYAIQHERRKHANNVHDFGLRFPQAPAQRVRDALAYNKEVAILSGVAKYEGMPAAPDMRGASSQELDDDFEAMNLQRGRGPVPQAREPGRSFISDLRGIPPFGPGLGSAAEQFIEQNAWANPHHPSNAHLLQRQHSQQEPRRRSPPAEAPGGRRHSQQHPFSSSTISTTSNYAPYNGNSTTANRMPRAPTTSPETTRAASLLEQTSIRSMKAAATAAAAAAAAAAEAEQGRAVKRETAPPVGGF